MKRLGLLGGMSWESTIEYYRLVNELVAERLGGLHSADCLLRSLDFTEIELLQREDRWQDAGARLADEARALEAAGAELLVLCTNTMHKVADQITAAIGIPFVHIADTTADAVRAAGLARVGLLATGYTMEQDFYVGRLRDAHGLDVLVPDAGDRRIVHDVIYEELCRGIVDDGSRDEYRRIMAALARRPRRAGHPPRLHRNRPARRPRGLAGARLRHHPAARRARRHAGAGAVTGFGCGRRVCGIASAEISASAAATAARMNASV
jgi:aspartate racemase